MQGAVEVGDSVADRFAEVVGAALARGTAAGPDGAGAGASPVPLGGSDGPGRLRATGRDGPGPAPRPPVR